MSSRTTLTRFARILLTMGSGESAWLIVAFVLGVMALGVLSNFVYSAVLDFGSLPDGSVARAGVAVAVLIALAYAAYRYDLLLAAQPLRFNTVFDEKSLAPPHAGLIWLLGPGKLDLPLFAIQYHIGGTGESRLRHCWVLVTPETQETFARLSARAGDLGLKAQLYPVTLEGTTIEACYRAVDSVYTTEAKRVGLKPEAIIADLTSGLKTMTAGMVLACLPFGRALEYIESRRDPETGSPVEGTQHPVLVGVDFKLES